MRPAASSFAVAFIAAALWLVWSFEHEYTSIRAPWTGVTCVASLCGFVAAGYLGRGLPALLIASGAAVAATLLVDPLVWQSGEDVAVPPTGDDCDPGCISIEAAAVMAAVGAALLAALGIVLRRAAARVRRSRAAA